MFKLGKTRSLRAGERTSDPQRRRKVRAVAGVMTFVLTVAGAAFAAWLLKSAGNGATGIGTAQAITLTDLTAAQLTGAKLVPGGSGDLELEITNPNEVPVNVAEVCRMRSSQTDGSSCNAAPIDVSGSTCDNAWVSYSQGTVDAYLASNPTTLVAAVDGAPSVTRLIIPGAVTLDSAATGGCQGEIVTIPVTVFGKVGT